MSGTLVHGLGALHKLAGRTKTKVLYEMVNTGEFLINFIRENEDYRFNVKASIHIGKNKETEVNWYVPIDRASVIEILNRNPEEIYHMTINHHCMIFID